LTADQIIAVVTFGILLEVCRQDLFHRRIPNWTSLSLATLGIGRWLVKGDLNALLWAFIAALCVLAGTIFLTWRNMMGGGDAKLLPALTLLVSGQETLKNSTDLLIRTALIGGVVSLGVLAWSIGRRGKVKLREDGTRVRADYGTVPYGIAIAAAGVWVLTYQVIES